MVLNNLKKIFFKGKKYNKKQIKHSLDNIIKVSTFISSNKKFNISDNFYSRYEIILIFIYYIKDLRMMRQIKKDCKFYMIFYLNILIIL